MNSSRESDQEAKYSLDLMASSDKIQYNKDTPPASENEALLGEFFSVIAGVVIRLIKDTSSLDKNGRKTKPEGEKPC
jgi:hypothetical protein